jgi:hypothetical protein
MADVSSSACCLRALTSMYPGIVFQVRLAEWNASLGRVRDANFDTNGRERARTGADSQRHETGVISNSIDAGGQQRTQGSERSEWNWWFSGHRHHDGVNTTLPSSSLATLLSQTLCQRRQRETDTDSELYPCSCHKILSLRTCMDVGGRSAVNLKTPRRVFGRCLRWMRIA